MKARRKTVAVKKRRHPGRSVSYDWDAIKVRYITTQATFLELQREFGATSRYINRMAQAGGWDVERAKFRREIAQKGLDEIKEEMLTRHKEAIRIVYALKTAVANKLLKKSQDPNWQPTLKDLDLLQRLELDLLGVGKRSSDAIINITIAQRVENVLARVHKERDIALEGDSRRETKLLGSDPGLAGFLYGRHDGTGLPENG